MPAPMLGHATSGVLTKDNLITEPLCRLSTVAAAGNGIDVLVRCGEVPPPQVLALGLAVASAVPVNALPLVDIAVSGSARPRRSALPSESVAVVSIGWCPTDTVQSPSSKGSHHAFTC